MNILRMLESFKRELKIGNIHYLLVQNKVACPFGSFTSTQKHVFTPIVLFKVRNFSIWSTKLQRVSQGCQLSNVNTPTLATS
jgi:hypothetical protein